MSDICSWLACSCLGPRVETVLWFVIICRPFTTLKNVLVMIGNATSTEDTCTCAEIVAFDCIAIIFNVPTADIVYATCAGIIDCNEIVVAEKRKGAMTVSLSLTVHVTWVYSVCEISFTDLCFLRY